MKISNFKIGVRLAITLAIVLFLTALGTTISIVRLNEVEVSTKELFEANNKQILAQEWLKGISNNAITTIAKAKSSDLEDQKEFQKELEQQSAKVTEIQKELESIIKDEEGKRILGVILENRKKYIEVRNNIFKVKESVGENSKETIATLITSQMLPVRTAYVQSVQDFVDFQKKMFNKSQDKVLAVADASKSISIVFGFIAIMVGAILSWMLSRSITKPLNEAVAVAKTISSGDLTKNIQVESTDEVGELLLALKEMNNNLANIVGQVRHGTETMTIASKEIAAGNLDLSSRTEEQASSLEETASSMEELTSTVKQNADNAKQANNLASSASEISIKGGEVVFQVVETMKEINDSSKKVSDIISVIDGIAFQTNILALNAAVEAARAGEQGRGFAVVASEVRSLAQRSAQAAKEIKSLIENSVNKVNSGSALVEQAGKTMAEVVDSIKRVTDIMSEITAASQEQASGIEQVNQAISQMDEVTQQNAALVEEASAASQSMQDEAAKLAQTVSVFKVDGVAISQKKIENISATKVVEFSKRSVKTRNSFVVKPQIKGESNQDWEEF